MTDQPPYEAPPVAPPVKPPVTPDATPMSSLAGIAIRHPARTGRRIASDDPGDLLAYWKRLRAMRRFPARADLDTKAIAFYWPHSVLFRVEGLAGQVAVEAAIAPRSTLRPGVLRHAGGTGPTPYALAEWLMSVAREAAASECPTVATATLSAGEDKRTYRGTALPLSDDQRIVDHVLAYYEPVD